MILQPSYKYVHYVQAVCIDYSIVLVGGPFLADHSPVVLPVITTFL
jgi:hypothetical protein